MAWVYRFLAACLAVSASLALPAAAQTTVKLGVILSLSGPDSSPGIIQEKALDLYVKTHAKDLPPGVKLEIVKRDDTGPNPEVAKRVAQELVTRDHVQLLWGVIYSPNAVAVAPVATAAKIPFRRLTPRSPTTSPAMTAKRASSKASPKAADRSSARCASRSPIRK